MQQSEDIHKAKSKHKIDERVADHTGRKPEDVRKGLNPRIVKIAEEYLKGKKKPKP